MRTNTKWTCLLAATALAAPMMTACTDGTGRATAYHQQADGGPVEEPDAGPPPDKGCTYTQGYWKNHPEDWPVSSLVIGGRTYSAMALMTILDTPPRGDASIVLARQLVTALLNLANGASPVPVIAEAQAWMSTYDPGYPLPYGIRASSPADRVATDLADRLADYNEGRTGPGHCDDVSYGPEPPSYGDGWL